MKHQKIKPTGIAQEFEINETFFSTTDRRGIVTAGNQGFSRTSGYEISELIGSPHNLIRHADMPRCVFKMLWETVGAGETFMGYVKNQAKNGNHYWVFALLFPVPSGFLSVRIKPNTETMNTVEGLYRNLVSVEEEALAKEETAGDAMDLSMAVLGEAIKSLGYATYHAFSRYCLNEEIKCRDLELARRNLDMFPDRVASGGNARKVDLQNVYHRTRSAYELLGTLFSSLDEFASINDGICERQSAVKDIAEEFRLNALNATIAAEHLGETGVTIGTITGFLLEHAKTLSSNVDTLAGDISGTTVSVSDISSCLAAARLQFEMLLSFLAEIGQSVDGPEGIDRLLTMAKDLRSAVSVTLKQATESVAAVQDKLPKLKDGKEGIRKLIFNLNVAQIAGLIESVRIEEADHLSSMFGDLRDRIGSAQGELVHLEKTVDDLTLLAGFTRPKVDQVFEYLAEPMMA